MKSSNVVDGSKIPRQRQLPIITQSCCADFDEDCEVLRDKVYCYMLDPLRGDCPYLDYSTIPETPGTDRH